MIEEIRNELEALWLDSICPDLMIINSKTLGLIYGTGEVGCFETLESKFEGLKIIASDSVETYKFYCSA